MDIKLSANTAFYPKWMDSFAATIGKQTHKSIVREPTMAHEYVPTAKPPIKPPPANIDPSTAAHDASLMSTIGSMGSKALQAITPSSSTMKWMADAALTLGEGSLETAEFAMKTAPMALEAAEFLLPLLLLDQPNLVSAEAEIARYSEVVKTTQRFGDDALLQNVQNDFKEAVAYYKEQMKEGKTYVLPYSKYMLNQPQ